MHERLQPHTCVTIITDRYRDFFFFECHIVVMMSDKTLTTTSHPPIPTGCGERPRPPKSIRQVITSAFTGAGGEGIIGNLYPRF